MSQDLDFSRMIRQIVRGERPPADLALVGLTLTSTRKGSYKLQQPSRGVSDRQVLVSIKDVAAGLVVHCGDSDALNAWGTILMAYDGVGVDEVDEAQHQVDFDLLLGAVWDASFEGNVQPEAVDRARELVGGCDELHTPISPGSSNAG